MARGIRGETSVPQEVAKSATENDDPEEIGHYVMYDEEDRPSPDFFREQAQAINEIWVMDPPLGKKGEPTINFTATAAERERFIVQRGLPDESPNYPKGMGIVRDRKRNNLPTYGLTGD